MSVPPSEMPGGQGGARRCQNNTGQGKVLSVSKNIACSPCRSLTEERLPAPEEADMGTAANCKHTTQQPPVLAVRCVGHALWISRVLGAGVFCFFVGGYFFFWNQLYRGSISTPLSTELTSSQGCCGVVQASPKPMVRTFSSPGRGQSCLVLLPLPFLQP